MAGGTILRNARIWTGALERPWASAIAVAEGRIVAVGEEAEVRAAAGRCEEMDLGGRVVAPGLMDNHVHFMKGGEYLLGLDLRDAAGPEEFARRVRAAVERGERGRWITGGRWDNGLWRGGVWPHRGMIDSFSAETPIFLRRADGHAGLANGRALALAGIGRATPNPPGGVIDRDAGGEATGILRDSAAELVKAHIPKPTEGEKVAMVRAALRHAAELGVTGVCDMESPCLEVYEGLLRRGELTCRIRWYGPLEGRGRMPVLPRDVDERMLCVGGVKAFMDGSLGSRTAWLFEPFADDRGSRGLPMGGVVSGELAEGLLEADGAGLQVALHAIGDRANAEALDVAERMARVNGARDRRMRIEHAQHLRGEDVGRFGRLGVIASVQPAHVPLDGPVVEPALGAERAGRTYAFRSLLDAGARVTFGTDWPVTGLDPLANLRAAVTRGVPGFGGRAWRPEQCVGVEEGLRCMTAGNAYAMFAEGYLGRLAPGMAADLVVLSEDVFRLPRERLGEARVVMTMVAGRVVFGKAECRVQNAESRMKN